MLTALAGILAGFLHVLSGPDHMAAIAPYATQGRARAWRTGVRWGFGHSAGVVVVGIVALLLRDKLGLEPVSAWGERLVGVMLIGIGVWGVLKAIAARRARADHPHGEPAPRVHGHTAFGVGTVHGLAGSSHILGIAPALLMPSATAAAAYLVFFGGGTIVAMAIFSFAIGWIADRPAARGLAGQSALLGLCSVLALGVGGFWLVSALPAHAMTALAFLVKP
jgi:hypothetical protein